MSLIYFQKILQAQDNVDSLIIIPNERLLSLIDRKTSSNSAFAKADEVLQQTVQGITDLINQPALLNLDFADINSVMKDKGMAHIGIGTATGDSKAEEAVKYAVTSPLLETSIRGASHVIINITGDISLIEANDAATYVQELAGEGANIIFGAVIDESLDEDIVITVIATGFEDEERNKLGSMPVNKIVDKAWEQTIKANPAPTEPATNTASDLDIPSFLRKNKAGKK